MGTPDPVLMGWLWVTGPSHRLAVGLAHEALHSSNKVRSPSMLKDLVHRTWRIAVTVGPLVAIALTLAAGMKWR